MGWLYTHKPRGMPVAQFLIQHGALRWTDSALLVYTVLDTATINLTQFYAAVETRNTETGEREVWAAVFLLHFCRGRHNFGYKDMTESMGPCEAQCPQRILDLLTPTDNANALEWRQRCRANLALRATVRSGVVITLHGQDYRVCAQLGRRGFLIETMDSAQRFRLSHAKARDVSAVRAPSTH